MPDRREPSSLLSFRVLSYLKGLGHSQAEIARMMGVSEGFISLINSKSRSFSLAQLEALAERMDTGLGELLINATEPKRAGKSSAFFDASARLIRKADAVSGALRRQTVKK
jgi:transcriptional regulator with XRE-family HTH domain